MIAQILSKENMTQAYNQVRKNKGAAGIDGKSVDDFSAYLGEHWPSIKHQVESGSYQPAPILGTTITLDRLDRRGYVAMLSYYLKLTRG